MKRKKAGELPANTSESRMKLSLYKEWGCPFLLGVILLTAAFELVTSLALVKKYLPRLFGLIMIFSGSFPTGNTKDCVPGNSHWGTLSWPTHRHIPGLASETHRERGESRQWVWRFHPKGGLYAFMFLFQANHSKYLVLTKIITHRVCFPQNDTWFKRNHLVHLYKGRETE